MSEVAYGVWDGIVYDNREGSAGAGPAFPSLANFDEFDAGNAIRAFVADRGFVVFDPTVSLLDTFYRQLAQAAEQSCGKCTPCRIGTVLVRDALDALRRGERTALDLDQIFRLADQMTRTSMCGLGQTCSRALRAAIREFPEVFEAEIRAAPAPAQNAMSYMTAPCIEACPSRINVPRYIDYIKDGKPAHSLGVILQKYPMAATCGRVCVRFCEMACRRKFVDEAVGIKTLKRYVADQQKGPNALVFGRDLIREPLGANMRVAVVGAGPAGISCAYHLLLHGYRVDILEAMEDAGGMAARGIPSYRLPKDVLRAETDIITALGGRFLFDKALGRDFSIDDLFARGYRAVFLSLGCQEGTRLGIENEDPKLAGYQSGVGFLLRVHDHVAGALRVALEGDVVVVGGGNVAMDCARSALRMGASAVHVLYRRTRKDMPADADEVKAAEAEGVVFHFLTNPKRIVAEDGRVAGVELIDMQAGEPDDEGRSKVAPVAGSERIMACGTLIAAIGQQVRDGVLSPEDGIAFDRWNCIRVNPDDLTTSRPGVFAGGDCATGPSTLIHAMAAGLKATRSIDDYIRLGHIRFRPRSRMRRLLNDNTMLAEDAVELPVKHQYRAHHPELDAAVRSQMFEEVEQTISVEAAYREASRCMRCYRIYSVITERPIPEGVGR
ncbi:MAG: FAD-dependent oxidoreductase [Pseudomonadota bacterium]